MKVNWSKYWHEYKTATKHQPTSISANKPAEQPAMPNKTFHGATNLIQEHEIQYHKELVGPHRLAPYIERTHNDTGYVPPKRDNKFTHDIIDD